MLKRISSSFILASALVGTMVAPSLSAEEGTFQSIVTFPVRVVGSAFGGTLGVPLGAFKDSVVGWQKSTKYVAGAMGKEDGDFQTIVGGSVGGPVGFTGGAAYGTVDGFLHGVKAGYKNPFGKDSFTFKDK